MNGQEQVGCYGYTDIFIRACLLKIFVVHNVTVFDLLCMIRMNLHLLWLNCICQVFLHSYGTLIIV